MISSALATLFAGDIAKKIFGFLFDTTLGEIVLFGSVAAGLIVGFAYDQRSVGRTQAVAEMERKDAKGIELSGKARSVSRSGSSQRVLDPYVRSE